MGIALKNVDFTYQQGTPFEGKALSSINLEIPDGSYTAIIGHTGSGKSTLLQLLNGLLKPTKGEVQFGSYSISALSEPKEMKYMRKKVGLVFQFPENQLFAETILTDVAFGPQNFGIEKEEAEKLAKEKLALVGIEEELYEKSPFELSGGQMRRVAIAGILAMEPEVLVLDEPTAGLDPSGRRELMDLFQSLHQNGLTIVLVTHTMDDVADFADHVFVLDHGKLVMEGAPNIIFQRVKELEAIQLGVPKITKFAYSLQKKGLNLEYLPVTIPEFKEMLVHE